MPIAHSLRTGWRTLRAAQAHLAAGDPLRMAGATAFFATFGLPAILIIVVRILGIFVGRRTVGRQLGDVLRAVLGIDSVDAIRKTIGSFRELQSGPLPTAAIFLFLLFVATTFFKVIRRSINDIWSIQGQKPTGLLRLLKSRAVSLAVMLLGGLVFMAVHMLDTMQRKALAGSPPEGGDPSGRALHIVVVMLVSTIWFFAVYWYLPDGRPSRKVVLGGALVTSALFSAGKIGLHAALNPGRLNGFFGTSGAIVLVLLFVFYASLILYFGAALIRAVSEAAGTPVAPKAGALRYRIELDE